MAGFLQSSKCQLRGICPLSNSQFLFGGTNLRPTIKKFFMIFNDVRHALWAGEISVLIANQPTHLYQVLPKGNYNALSQLTGEFQFFTSAFDYYVQLGGWMTYFHNMGEKFFTMELILMAIENFNNMVFINDNMLEKTVGAAYAELDAMERGEISTCLTAEKLKILRLSLQEQKSLTQLGTGALELFSHFQPRSDMTQLGLIRTALGNSAPNH
jgi:hypothetical protein